ncbi:UPF0735 ACT domain-containing protein [Clostridium polyendosporum]|uniref:UPF0735 ACT domain-containing protein CPJCM30710_16860 n=1 Tax=Clostridium polyendosporum TaxID=69208 RepID=A0A919S0Q4_9CLOT|nr:ACT domain-containing protein [Clostridium polyendosporum]GIM29020.1 UPF0735 ACT domain-containing protein [Clostridium polyendosporum]
MREDRFYIVNEKVLPEIFLKVIKVKELLYTGQVKDITEGAREVGISRSAYYKYKDYVYPMSEGVNSKKLTMYVSVSHEAGSLSRVLDEVAEAKGNILTINQDIPINMTCYCTITIDVSSMNIQVNELIERITSIPIVKNVKVFAME